MESSLSLSLSLSVSPSAPLTFGTNDVQEESTCAGCIYLQSGEANRPEDEEDN